MNGDIRQIGMDEVPLDGLSIDEREAVVLFSKRSNPILLAEYDGVPVALIGLIPKSLLSGSTYLWLHTYPGLVEHKVAFARGALRLIAWIKSQYPHIYGHCFSDSSWGWLKSLGATQVSPNEFEIV